MGGGRQTDFHRAETDTTDNHLMSRLRNGYVLKENSTKLIRLIAFANITKTTLIKNVAKNSSDKCAILLNSIVLWRDFIHNNQRTIPKLINGRVHI